MNKGLTQEEKLAFTKRIETQTNKELTSVYLNQQDYRPEFIDLVTEELKKREYISDKQIDVNEILNFIKINTEETRKKRELDVINVLQYGNDLWHATGAYIFQLKNAIVSENIEYQNIISELALEILVCSITAWNDSIEKGYNDLPLYEDILELAQKAQSMLSSGEVYDKICIEINTMEGVINKAKNSIPDKQYFDTSNTKNTAISIWNIFAIGTWIVAILGLLKMCS